MDNFKLFLESSSIHGLAYISVTERLVKVFWILTIFTGFCGAILLISQSFEAWENNPVTTTIDTKPIVDISYPKVTVCPPKQSYTNLNYDIMKVGNTTIDYDLTEENNTAYLLLKSLEEYFLYKDFETVFKEMIHINEKNKYMNWYTGLTKVPESEVLSDILITSVKPEVKTYASTGTVSSPYFQDKFDSDKFKLKQTFDLDIENPDYDEAAWWVTQGNISLVINYDVVDNFECITVGDGKCLDSSKNEFRIEQSNFQGIKVHFSRSFPQLNFNDWAAKRFTGFKVEWKYEHIRKTNKSTPWGHSWSYNNRHYITIANLVQSVGSEEAWNIIIKVKDDYWANMFVLDVDDAFEEVEVIISEDIDVNITVEALEVGAEIFTYFMAPPEDYWKEWYFKYKEWLKQCSLRRLLGITHLLSMMANKCLIFLVTIAGVQDVTSNSAIVDNLDFDFALTKVEEVKEIIFRDLSRLLNLTLHQFENKIGMDNQLDSKSVHRITNHPVHIIDENGKLSPSAFIPFCEFGGNMSIMGENISHFDVPVCKSFTPVILNDQLCYEINPNKFISLSSPGHAFDQGLQFYIDINEDRQTNTTDTDFMIYLNTLGVIEIFFLKSQL